MYNLNLYFSDKFLDQAKELGECLEIGDSKFYLKYTPYKGVIAKVYAYGGQITVSKLEERNSNEYWTASIFSKLNETGALEKLKELKEE